MTPETKNYLLRFEQADYDKLKDRADKELTTISVLIRKAIKILLKKK